MGCNVTLSLRAIIARGRSFTPLLCDSVVASLSMQVLVCGEDGCPPPPPIPSVTAFLRSPEGIAGLLRVVEVCVAVASIASVLLCVCHAMCLSCYVSVLLSCCLAMCLSCCVSVLLCVCRAMCLSCNVSVVLSIASVLLL
jgi:hypothetical protein